MVRKYSGVENFPNGSEPTVELKIRRCCLSDSSGLPHMVTVPVLTCEKLTA
jgi:hypothetical protein